MNQTEKYITLDDNTRVKVITIKRKEPKSKYQRSKLKLNKDGSITIYE
jgi:DNA-directed RNA polymerase subunit E'/Rpb7